MCTEEGELVVFTVCLSSLRWTETLKENAPTTQLIIIGSVPAFLKFLLEAQHPDVTAPSKRLQTALWTLKTMAMMCRKGLERHRQAVRTKTSGRSNKCFCSQSVRILQLTCWLNHLCDWPQEGGPG